MDTVHLAETVTVAHPVGIFPFSSTFSNSTRFDAANVPISCTKSDTSSRSFSSKKTAYKSHLVLPVSS